MTYFHIFLPTMFSVRALRCVLTQPTRAISSKSIEMYTHKKNEYKQRPDPIRLYRTLNLPVNASTQDIKNCYYELAKKYHPDANRSSSEAYEKFQEINEAYEVLSDQKKRFNYDRFGIVPREKELTKKSTENGTFDKFYKIMRRSDMMIKEIFQPSRELSNSYIDMDTKNLPLNDFPDEIPVSISFVESISGGEKEVYVPVKIKCQKCKHNGNYGDKLFEVCKYCNGVGFKSFPSTPGTEEVKIACKFCKGAQYSYKMICPDCSAKGFVFEYKKLIIPIPELVETGHVFKLKHPTKRRTIDVKFTVIKDHLRRDGLNLKSSTEISLSQAVFGCFITIKGLNEHNYVEIAAGTQSNTEITVIGKGIKNLANGEVGNHILTIKVKIPTKLTKEQRIILKQYADAERKSDAESFQKHNILL